MENFNIFKDIVEYYKSSLGEGISVYIFIQMFSMLMFFFVVRYFIYLKMENLLFKKNPTKLDEQKRIYLFGHMTIELLLGFFITYSLVIIRGSQINNYIWNMIIAPGLGLVIAAFIDIKFFMDREEDSPLDMYMSRYISSKKKSNKNDSKGNNSPANNLAPSINVQVNTGDGNVESSGKKNAEVLMGGSGDAKPIKDHIKIDTMADDFNENILKTINDMVDVQLMHDASINKIVDTVDNIQTIVKNLQKTEMKEYQIKLETMMYMCLDKGFATPAENKEIESGYYCYTKLLGGNGDIKNLHDTRYIHIDIHEDRRKTQSDFEGEDKRKKKYKYDET